MNQASRTSATGTPAIFQSQLVRDCLIALGLLVALLIVYWPALNGQPVWDDNHHLTAPDLQSWAGLGRIWWDLKATQQYYPLTHSVFWIERRLWGDWYIGYHIANICLHTLSAFPLVRILRALEFPGAWLAAALWAAHPVQVESLAWMSELKNCLSGVFYFSAALIYLRFDRERTAKLWLTALGLFALGLLSKSVIATLPGALLLIIWWRRGRVSWKQDVLPLIPFFAVGAGYGALTSWVEKTYIGAQGSEFHLSLIERCLVAGHAFWFYLGKLAWPADLIFIYPHWNISAAAPVQYIWPVATLAVAGILIVMRKQWGSGPLVAMLSFAGTLFPALGFVDVFPFR
jgi:protein O-mannosyl-transferase